MLLINNSVRIFVPSITQKIKAMYLEGVHHQPKKESLLPLVGKHIVYLCSSDIDKSGRGYFFPKSGTIEGFHRNCVVIDGNHIAMSSIKEIVTKAA